MTKASENKRRVSASAALRQLLLKREAGIACLLALTVIVVTVVNPGFLAPENIRDLLVNAAPVAIVACGVTLVVVAGEIDISVGSMMGLLAAVLGLTSSTAQLNWPVAVSVCVTVAAGGLIGLVNGLLVAVAGIPSIIVTLGMLTVLRGITELVMQGEWVTDLPASLRFIGTGSFAGIPVSVLTAVCVIILTILISRRTAAGRRIYAVGSNAHSARLYGLSIVRTKLLVFVLTGLLTGVATVVSVPQLSVVESGIGIGFELLVITCVVVGGTSIRGGIGTISGTVLGVLLLTIVRTVLIFLKLGASATYWERAVQGAFILLAVLADHIIGKRANKEAK